MIEVIANWQAMRKTTLHTESMDRVFNSRAVLVAESHEEALAKEAIFFISDKPCKKHFHQHQLADGTIRKGTVRYTNGKRCVNCAAERRRRNRVRRSKSEEELAQAAARRRIEDLKIARECGLNLSDLGD